MRVILYAMLLLVAILGLALFAQEDPGYVMVAYRGWVAESSLSLLVLLLLLLFALFYLLLRTLGILGHFPAHLRLWRRRRRLVRIHQSTNRGLYALAEGEWARAERLLIRNVAQSDTPLINYLGAARAAQKQGKEAQRDDYLAQAYQSMPEAELAVGLTQAEVQLSNGQEEQALATLQQLRAHAPRHHQVLYLLQKLYTKLGAWGELLAMLPDLKRNHILSDDQLTRLEEQIHLERITQAGSRVDTLQEYWETIPRGWRSRAPLLRHYCERLHALGADPQAEPLLRDALRNQWESELMRLYGLLRGDDPNRQLVAAERWLKEHERHPELLLALGRLALQAQLWGKARSYLESAYGLDPRPETCCELGNLLEQTGEAEGAARYYRQGLKGAIGPLCTEFHIPHPPAHNQQG